MPLKNSNLPEESAAARRILKRKLSHCFVFGEVFSSFSVSVLANRIDQKKSCIEHRPIRTNILFHRPIRSETQSANPAVACFGRRLFSEDRIRGDPSQKAWN